MTGNSSIYQLQRFFDAGVNDYASAAEAIAHSRCVCVIGEVILQQTTRLHDNAPGHRLAEA